MTPNKANKQDRSDAPHHRKIKIPRQGKTKKWIWALGWGLLIAPIVLYYAAVFKFAINIPFADDYLGGFGWLEAYIASSPLDKFLSMFHQANEHRLFSYFFMNAVLYELFGELDFRHLIYFGNIWMLALLWLLYKVWAKRSYPLIAFTPVVLVLFVPMYLISDWGIMTMNGTFQYFIVFLSLYLLTRRGFVNFGFAVFLAAIATFSFGTGMLVFLIGFIILFLQKPVSKVSIMLWAGFMVMCVWLYFINYSPNVSPYSKTAFLEHPIQAVLFFFTLFGNLFNVIFKQNLIPYFIAGFTILAAFTYVVLARWKYHLKHPLAKTYLLFILITAAAGTVSRLAGGIPAAIQYRYLLMPVLFVAVLYITAFDAFPAIRRRWLMFFVVASVIIFALRYTGNTREMKNHKSVLKDELLSYYTNPQTMKTRLFTSQMCADLLDNAIQSGVYQPPAITTLFPKVKLLKDVKIISETNNLLFSIDKINDHHKFFRMYGWFFLPGQKGKAYEKVIVLKSPNDTLLFSTHDMARPDVVTYFSSSYPKMKDISGFTVVIDKTQFVIPSQNYEIGICLVKNGKMEALQYTGKFVAIGIAKQK